MSLRSIANRTITAIRKPVTEVAYTPEVGDTVILLAIDENVEILAIGYPYTDTEKRYYVQGDGFTDWVTEQEIF